MKIHLSPGQEAVLRTISDTGPVDDVGLAYFVHHRSPHDMSSSGARSRRAELVDLGLLTVVGTSRTKSNRNAAIHDLTPKGQRALSALSQGVI